jgi:CheY-like chemotaxis protein
VVDRPIDVLVIDDDDLTVEMVRRSLSKFGASYRVVGAADGQDGLEVLRKTSDRTVDRPCLILLDLNMPRMNGFEFLEELRNDANLLDSVVFVLSTSDADADRVRAYQEQIAGYMIKSSIGPQFSRLSTFLMQYAATVAFP